MKKLIILLLLSYGAKCQVQTINVTKDTTITAAWNITAKYTVINLNGHKMTFLNEGPKFIIAENSILMVKNGFVFPEKNWCGVRSPNSCMQWRNLNVGAEGRMCNNIKTNVPFVDKM
jgi:hypothetical protein